LDEWRLWPEVDVVRREAFAVCQVKLILSLLAGHGNDVKTFL
jgi:hypothetical protein